MKTFRYNNTTIATVLPLDTMLTVTRRLAGKVYNADGTPARNVFDATIAECNENSWFDDCNGTMGWEIELSASENRFTGTITQDNTGKLVALNDG
jgi:hypothetical protein